MRNHTRRGVTWLLLGGFIASVAVGQEPVKTLETVTVTADFREASLYDLDGSVTVLGAREIEDAGLQHFASLTQLVPNLNAAGGTSRPRYFQIRGIGELEQYEGAPNPSVGFLLDDIDFSGVGGVATLFDVEQIEVLRGPQGTRYGANALAGLIYVRSVAPTPYFDLRAEALAGEDDTAAGGVAFGGPVGESAAYRLMAHRYTSDGQRNNRYLGASDTNERDETTMRARLRFDGLPGLEVDATAMYVDLDNGYDAWALDSSRDTLSDKPGRDAQESSGGALRLAWDMSERMHVVSITTAADSDIDFSFDGDWGNDEYWGVNGPYDFFSATERQRTTLSQELRLMSRPGAELLGGRTSWLLGVYALRLQEDNDVLDRFNGEVFRSLDSSYDAVNGAVFAQADTRLTPRAELSLGLRLERRWADYDDSAGVSFDPTDTMPGGHLSLSYALRPNTSAYATVSRGYKAGGFNVGTLVPESLKEYDPEYLWNYEVGLKTGWPERGVLATLALFYSDRKDAQVSTSFQVDPTDPLTFIFLTDNAAEGESYGAEAELDWQLHRDWTLHASLGLLKTRFNDYEAAGRDLSGRDMAFAPHYTFDLAVTYRNARGVFGRLEFAGKDGFYYADSHDKRANPYEVVHAKLGYEARRWAAYVWGRNVLDEKHSLHGFYFANEPPDWQEKLYEQQADPRQLGVTFTYRF